MKRIIFFMLFLIVTAPGQVMAEEWRFDKAHTNFFFEVRHTYALVRGQFGEFSGEVVFDPASPEKSRFNFTIQADSVDTRISKRDTHLRTADFFDTKKYPEIKFRSTRVAKAVGNKYIVDGKLTIKNVSKDVSLMFKFLGEKENPLKPGEIVAGFDANLRLDRLEFGVGNGKFSTLGVVGKEVDIFVTLELLRDN